MKRYSDQSLKQINRITEKIIGCAFQLNNKSGTWFLEKVYERALAHEMTKPSFFEKQVPLKVNYEGIIVSEYAADLLIGNAFW